MSFILKPWHLFLSILVGLVNHKAQQIIEFQNAQIKALLKISGRKRILLTNELRRIIAVKGKVLGRKAYDGTDDHRHARYDLTLASETHCSEMGL